MVKMTKFEEGLRYFFDFTLYIIALFFKISRTFCGKRLPYTVKKQGLIYDTLKSFALFSAGGED